MKVREVIRMLESAGWRLVRTGGSHRQFRHATMPGGAMVAGKPGLEIPAGTLKSICKQAGMER
ncbi:MAG: type II toxin-antitoxin system HicA family toxin [Planctomycetota bacterium]